MNEAGAGHAPRVGIALAVIRIALAVLFAPLSALLSIGLLVVLFGSVLEHESFELSLNFEMLALVGLPIAYAAALLIGLPAHLLLRRLGFDSIAAHAAVGAVAGLLIGVYLFGLYELLWRDASLFLIYGGLSVLPAATVAAVFGAIAGRALRNGGPDSAS